MRVRKEYSPQRFQYLLLQSESKVHKIRDFPAFPQKGNLVPSVLSFSLEKVPPVAAGHVSTYANQSRTEGGSST